MFLRRTPHPVTVAIRDKKDLIRVLLYSYHTTSTEWGPPEVFPINLQVGNLMPNVLG